ncbi:aldo/keto reductase [Lewinellaceae bacterium SD302]|nr:aldo/keto reductase [Lewinellaceae bacterium SD302]
MKNITLNDGNKMPQLGLGVWQSDNGSEVINAIHWALDAGYRHVDTARIYKNEEGVGEALKSAATPRDQVFLTTKIWNDDIRQGRAAAALDESLDRLQTDYVDLLLLHWPVDGYEAAWEALEQAREAGKVKSIGLSNFMPEHLNDILKSGSVVPAVNQIEYHPYLHQQDVADACAAQNIALTAWSPLMQGHFKDESLFSEIGEQHGKSAAQVVLRWDLQRGVITIPKSVHEGRIKENFDVFDFELSSDEMEKINALNKEHRFGPDPRDFDF